MGGVYSNTSKVDDIVQKQQTHQQQHQHQSQVVDDSAIRNRERNPTTTQSSQSYEQIAQELQFFSRNSQQAGASAHGSQNLPVGSQHFSVEDIYNAFGRPSGNTDVASLQSHISASLTEVARQQQQHQHQSAQALTAAVARTRSPAHHSLQQVPGCLSYQGGSRPPSGSFMDMSQQQIGRPGSATSFQGSHRNPQGLIGMKANQTQQQQVSGFSSQLGQVYPHRPTSAAHRPYSSHAQQNPSSNSLSQAFNALAHSEHFQDLCRMSQSATSVGSVSASSASHGLPSKRPRLVSSGGGGYGSPRQAPVTDGSPAAMTVAAATNILNRQTAHLLQQGASPSTASTVAAFLAVGGVTGVGGCSRVTAGTNSGTGNTTANFFHPTQTAAVNAVAISDTGVYTQRGVNAQRVAAATVSGGGAGGGASGAAQLLVSSSNSMSPVHYPTFSSLVSYASAAAVASQHGGYLSNAGAGASVCSTISSSSIAAAAAAHQSHHVRSSGAHIGQIGVSGNFPKHQQHPPLSVPQQPSRQSSGKSPGGVYMTTTAQSSTSSHHAQVGRGAQVTVPSSYLSHSSAIPQGSGVLRQQTKEPAYHPQVEAISPAPEEARIVDAQDAKLQRDGEELTRQLNSIDAEIKKQEAHLRFLGEKETTLANGLHTEAPRAKVLTFSGTDVADERTYENPIQAKARVRARQHHHSFQKLCGRLVNAGPCALPLYRQPSDLASLRAVQTEYRQGFRTKLIKYIHHRKRAEKARLKYLSKQYAHNAQIFFKKHEKLMNSLKRRQRDIRHRELFEKTFPEVKKIREDQERTSNPNVGDAHGDGVSNIDSNGADTDQAPLYDPVEELAKMKEYAIDPPVPLAPWEKSYQFVCTAYLTTDPKSEHTAAQNLDKWTDRDKAVFKERFLATPKNFTSIASYLGKPVSECIHYYYLSKKTEGYKALVKKHTARRPRARPSDKSGPTGTSHSTNGAHTSAPVRTATPSNVDGERGSTPNDLKTEDIVPHGGSKKSGGSSRGRSSRNRGHGNSDAHHRGSKGANKVTTSTATSSSTSSVTGCEIVSLDSASLNSEAPMVFADVKSEQLSEADIVSSTAERPLSVAEPRAAGKDGISWTQNREVAPQLGISAFPNVVVTSSVPIVSSSVSSLITNRASSSSNIIQDLIHQTIEKNYTQPAVSRQPTPQHQPHLRRAADLPPVCHSPSIPTSMTSEGMNPVYPCVGYPVTSSVSPVTSTAPGSDPIQSDSLRMLPSRSSGQLGTHAQGALACYMAAAYPGLWSAEQLDALTKSVAAATSNGCGVNSQSPSLQQQNAAAAIFGALAQAQPLAQVFSQPTTTDLPDRRGALANIQQMALDAVAAAVGMQTTSHGPLHLSKATPANVVISMGNLLGGAGSAVDAQASSHPPASVGGSLTSVSDASAYNKAILIGDFCTAQQLGAAGHLSSGIAASLVSGIHRTVDYNDPTYINTRAIDPCMLPTPSGRSGSSMVPSPVLRPLSRTLSSALSGVVDPALQAAFRKNITLPVQSSVRRDSHRHVAPTDRTSPLVSSRSSSLSTTHQRPSSSHGGDVSNRPVYCPLSPSSPKNDVHGGGVSCQIGRSASSFELSASTMIDCKTCQQESQQTASISANIANYVDQANRTYREEVEQYTSRDRSDSMRTRTSSEASQFVAAVRNLRQRTGAFGSLPPYATGNTANASTNIYKPLYSDSVGLAELAERYQNSELLAKHTLALANANQLPMVTALARGPDTSDYSMSRKYEALAPDILRSSRNSPDHQAYTNISPVRDSDQRLGPPQSYHPLPRYRKPAFTNPTSSIVGSSGNNIFVGQQQMPRLSEHGFGAQSSEVTSSLLSNNFIQALTRSSGRHADSSVNLEEAVRAAVSMAPVTLLSLQQSISSVGCSQHSHSPHIHVTTSSVDTCSMDPRLHSGITLSSCTTPHLDTDRLSPRNHSSMSVCPPKCSTSPSGGNNDGAESRFRPPEPHLSGSGFPIVGTLSDQIDKAIAEGIKTHSVPEVGKVRIKSPHQPLNIIAENDEPVRVPKKRSRLSSSLSLATNFPSISSSSSSSTIATDRVALSPGATTSPPLQPKVSRSSDRHTYAPSSDIKSAGSGVSPQPRPFEDHVVGRPSSRSIVRSREASPQPLEIHSATQPIMVLAARCSDHVTLNSASTSSALGSLKQTKSPNCSSVLAASPSSGADSPGNLQICLSTEDDCLQSPAGEGKPLSSGGKVSPSIRYQAASPVGVSPSSLIQLHSPVASIVPSSSS